MAVLKRLKFAASSEAYSAEQQRLLFETIDADLEALSAEMEQLVNGDLKLIQFFSGQRFRTDTPCHHKRL
jgi:hypothetical protein